MNAKSIPLAGVIGAPIVHSKSPALHRHWLQRYGINGHYVPIELTQDNFADGLKSLPRLGFRGVNITMPFKKAALDLADTVTDRAALIGAANTLTFRKDGRIHADNTDGFGFIANLHQYAPDWRANSGPVLVLGAGGAAGAVLSALLNEGAPQIYLANRTKTSAEMMREKFGARIKVIDLTKVPAMIGDVSLLVNATSLGMAGKSELQLDLKALNKNTLVTDLVYNPLRTSLLDRAAALGCHTVDGLGMLLHQAAPGFENWFRKKPTVDEELRQVVLNA